MTIKTDIEGAPVLTGPWPDPVVPDTSLPEFLLATAKQQAERAAIIDASSGRVSAIFHSPRMPGRYVPRYGRRAASITGRDRSLSLV